MAAKTTKENQHFLDMMDNSSMPEMGLIGAKLVDLEENAIDSNKKGATHRVAVMDMLGTISTNQDAYIKKTEENKKATKVNAQAITDIKIDNTVTVSKIETKKAITVALITSIFTTLGLWVAGII